MLKKLASAIFLFLFLFSTFAFGQLRVGYMNTQEVLSQIPERNQVEQQLNEFIEGKRSEFQQRTAAFQDSVAAYQQNQGNMSQAEIERKEQQLASMEQELNEYQQQIQRQIQQRRSELLQPIYERMDKAIAAVAEERGLDFVLNEATNTGEDVIFYASDESLDITQEVLGQMKN